MADVKVKVSSTGGAIVVVRIDGTKLTFASGKATRKCAGGRSHLVEHFATGQPGSTYLVTITDPVESRLVRGGTLDADQLDAGHAYFWVV